MILAGDFNSTLDHYTGLGSRRRRPRSLPRRGARHRQRRRRHLADRVPALLGAPIDHVMATPDWQIVGFRVIGSHDGDGSDHRPVLAQLRPAS